MSFVDMEVYGVRSVDVKNQQSARQRYEDEEAERRSRVSSIFSGKEGHNKGLTEDEIQGRRALLEMAGITTDSGT